MRKTIVVDYDGTLELGEGMMNQALIGKLNDQSRAGYRIIVSTSRDWLYLDYIEFHLDQAGLEYDQVHCGKPLADVYIDDKSMSWEDYVNQRNH